MVAEVLSCTLFGIDGMLISVEVDSSNGLPSYDTVGLPDKAVSESRERVRSALRNSGFAIPPRRITVNLAPADIKKIGTLYDLPIALGLLASNDLINLEFLKDSVFVGELALDGALRPIKGALSMAITSKNKGIKRFICPAANAVEAAYAGNIEIIPVHKLRDLVDGFKNGDLPIQEIQTWIPQSDAPSNDFSHIRGQYVAKRAAEIACAGGHNMILIGSPGGGKTMLARALPTILPDLSFEEALEITKIHSIAGALTSDKLVDKRPFLSPHHSASTASMVGGGHLAKPGEISLSHLGVLFLDELPEFERDVLEALRQPLEDGSITVARVNATASYPARFMLVGAMNPCPCGYFGSSSKECKCTHKRILQYRNRLSGPLLDRVDIFIGMEEITYKDLHSTSSSAESSKEIRSRVNACRSIQHLRFKGLSIYSNSQMSQPEIEKFCILERSAEKLYESEFHKKRMNGRANARTLRLARTIADMDESDLISEDHIAEALQYRAAENYWGNT